MEKNIPPTIFFFLWNVSIYRTETFHTDKYSIKFLWKTGKLPLELRQPRLLSSPAGSLLRTRASRSHSFNESCEANCPKIKDPWAYDACCPGQATRHRTVVVREPGDTRVMARAMPTTLKYPTTRAPVLFAVHFKLLEHQGSPRNQNTFLLPALLRTYGANKNRFFLFLYSPSAALYYCTFCSFLCMN